MNGIHFPGLGIHFENVPSSFNLFGIEIKLYAVVIAIGFMLALVVAGREARMSGQSEDTYLDFFLWLIIPAIVGARIYYVIFNWDEYYEKGKGFWKTVGDIVNIREGGLAIYGGLIVGVFVAFIFNKRRKLSLPLMGDTVCMGVLLGQMIGRWGNFFNRECFGAYTKSFIRMAIPVDYFAKEETLNEYLDSGVITNKMLMNPEIVGKRTACISVYPTFLLEGLWCLALIIFILLYRRHKKFDGELSLIYIMGYGIGRFFIEGMRTDSLMVGSLKVSQVVGLVCFFGAMTLMVYNHVRIFRGHEPKCHPVMKLSEYRELRAAEKADKDKTDKEKTSADKKTSEDKTEKKAAEKDDTDKKNDNKKNNKK
ncbi:MAG: prolipoprotein diacylglyceryl transferase [Eubacterium sp.]|nr:prolipoprotein diacylglyceryl transferase [Eubacterium sp.]